jgi:hypothetical protein
MTIRFGATILQVVPFPLLRDDFAFAEALGLDNAWVIDQFRIDGMPQIPLLDAWTTLAALGIDFSDGTGRSERLHEAVAILDRAPRGDTVTHHGIHFRLSDATFRPGPTQLPRPPLWVTAQSTRSLRVTVRYADAVVTLGEADKGIEESLPAFRARMTRLDDLCGEAGRGPSSIRRCYFAGWANEPIFASVDAAVDLIGRYVDAGATDFTFYLHNPAEPVLEDFVAASRATTRAQFERVAADVFPRFRQEAVCRRILAIGTVRTGWPGRSSPEV